MAAHSDIFPDVPRELSGLAYETNVARLDQAYEKDHVPLGERTYPEYRPAAEPGPDIARSAATAWIRQAHSSDPLDKVVADELVEDLMIRMKPHLPSGQQQTIEDNYKDTRWAEAILAGKPLQQAFSGFVPADPAQPVAPNGAVSQPPTSGKPVPPR